MSLSIPPVLLALGMPGMSEWMIILLIVLIFFGAGKLPAVLGQMGKGVKAFKEGLNSDDEAKGTPKEIEVKATHTSPAVTDAEEVKQA